MTEPVVAADATAIDPQPNGTKVIDQVLAALEVKGQPYANLVEADLVARADELAARDGKDLTVGDGSDAHAVLYTAVLDAVLRAAQACMETKDPTGRAARFHRGLVNIAVGLREIQAELAKG